MRRRKLWILAMMSVAALSFTACGSKQEETPASEEVVDFGKLTGKNDTTRMKIISALLEAELCVGDIAEITNSTQSAISHQLRVLKQAKLVKFRKEGKIVYYSLDDEHVSEMYEMAKRHIEEEYERK